MATPKLNLQDLFAAQAEAYFSINENNRALEAVLVGHFKSVITNTAPASPADGDTYVVGSAPPAGDLWENHAGEIAVYDSGSWFFYNLPDRIHAYIEDQNRFALWNGSIWLTLVKVGVSAPKGRKYLNPTTATVTLSGSDGENATIMLDGNTVTTVEFPVVNGRYWEVINNSSNDVSLKTIGGSGTVTVFAGKRCFVVCDGANLITAQDSFPYGFKMGGTLDLPVYSVASAPASAAFGALIFVSDGDAGLPCLAAWDGGSWKRVSLGTTISTT